MGTEARSPGKQPFIGFLDEVDSRWISGWAAHVDRGDPLNVYLVVDGSEIASQRAERLRPGVRRRGLHPTGECGFAFCLKPAEALKTGQKVQLLAGRDRWELRGSPRVYRPPTEDQTLAPRVFFMHVPKTAGSSLNELIASHYPRRRVSMHIESSSFREQPDFAERYHFISGHVRAHEMGRRMALDHWLWITLFREPIEHLASHLCWVRFIGEDPRSDFFRNHTAPIQALALRLQQLDFSNPADLAQLFDADDDRQVCNLFNNCQTRYLLRRMRPGRLDEQCFAEARQTLRRFDLLGTTEDYDTFMNLLHTRLGWTLPPAAPRRLNVQSKRYGLDLKRPELRSVLRAQTQFDRRIYQIAKRRLQAQWRAALRTAAQSGSPAGAAQGEAVPGRCSE